MRVAVCTLLPYVLTYCMTVVGYSGPITRGVAASTFQVVSTCEVGLYGAVGVGAECYLDTGQHRVNILSVDFSTGPQLSSGEAGINCMVVDDQGANAANITGVMTLTRGADLYDTGGSLLGTYTYVWNSAHLYSNGDLSGVTTARLVRCSIMREHVDNHLGIRNVTSTGTVECNSIIGSKADCTYTPQDAYDTGQLVVDLDQVRVLVGRITEVAVALYTHDTWGTEVVVGQYYGVYTGGDPTAGFFTLDCWGLYNRNTVS
eukprot:303849_1